MRRIAGWLGAVLLAVLLAGPARSADILVVRSSRVAAYEDAVRAFAAALGPAVPFRGPKQALPNISGDLALSDPDAPATFARLLKTRRPDLVLAVGGPALAALGDLEDVPVVHLFAANPAASAPSRANVVGVPLDVPPDTALDAHQAAAPRVRRVGIVHDPRRTAGLVAVAREAAAARGLTLEVREAASAREVPALLESLRGKVDALWMIPDLTVTTPETLEALATFSLRARVPVLTFAEKYLALGAALAVTLTPESLGEQAAALARLVLAGVPPSQARAREGPRVRVRINQTVANHLGLQPPDER